MDIDQSNMGDYLAAGGESVHSVNMLGSDSRDIFKPLDFPSGVQICHLKDISLDDLHLQ